MTRAAIAGSLVVLPYPITARPRSRALSRPHEPLGADPMSLEPWSIEDEQAEEEQLVTGTRRVVEVEQLVDEELEAARGTRP